MSIIVKVVYKSPAVKIVEVKVNGVVCTSPGSQTENTTEEELF